MGMNHQKISNHNRQYLKFKNSSERERRVHLVRGKPSPLPRVAKEPKKLKRKKKRPSAHLAAGPSADLAMAVKCSALRSGEAEIRMNLLLWYFCLTKFSFDVSDLTTKDAMDAINGSSALSSYLVKKTRTW